jgi:hypothetical protein
MHHSDWLNLPQHMNEPVAVGIAGGVHVDTPLSALTTSVTLPVKIGAGSLRLLWHMSYACVHELL